LIQKKRSIFVEYVIQEVAAKLKAARERKALSQRELAKLAGLRQSQISRIERGEVDLRLSSLVEIARALDLEITLVPRINLAAVQSIVRSSEKQAAAAPVVLRELQKLKDTVHSALQHYPSVTELAQLQRQIRDLQQLPNFELPDVNVFREATKAAQQFRNSTVQLDQLRRSLSHFQQLRNAFAHTVPPVEITRSAYSLEEKADG
jgi:transcriptional regulator with XRE-family HTH domain